MGRKDSIKVQLSVEKRMHPLPAKRKQKREMLISLSGGSADYFEGVRWTVLGIMVRKIQN